MYFSMEVIDLEPDTCKEATPTTGVINGRNSTACCRKVFSDSINAATTYPGVACALFAEPVCLRADWLPFPLALSFQSK